MSTPSTTAARLSDAAVQPLRTLDPDAPTDDLDWLDRAIGTARVVAIGESAHYNGEFYRLRHRLLRHLVERHGFTAYAMETGFVEAELVDGWVRGGEDPLGHVMANGMTSLMGLWAPMRAHLEWMRRHNATATRPVGFRGIDLPGSVVSLLPGLDAVAGYLAQADPEFRIDPGLRDTAGMFAAPSAFSAPATMAGYAGLAADRRDAVTAGLAELADRMTARQLDYRRRTGADSYERALHALRLTITLDTLARDMTRGDRHTVMLSRDAAMADTVEWILGREERIVLAAHNGHLLRCPATMPGMAPITPLGMHLADRLGDDYLVIGTTTATGQTLNTGPDFYEGRLFTDQEPPEAGSLDALMAASHDGPFAVDLRRLAPDDAATVAAASRQRFGAYYSDHSAADAYHLLVHVPHVTAAEPDPAALAAAPDEVRQAFVRWRPA